MKIASGFGGVLLAALASLCGVDMVSAQAAYPDRPVRLVVGYSPGASTDVVARELAKGSGCGPQQLGADRNPEA